MGVWSFLHIWAETCQSWSCWYFLFPTKWEVILYLLVQQHVGAWVGWDVVLYFLVQQYVGAGVGWGIGQRVSAPRGSMPGTSALPSSGQTMNLVQQHKINKWRETKVTDIFVRFLHEFKHIRAPHLRLWTHTRTISSAEGSKNHKITKE